MHCFQPTNHHSSFVCSAWDLCNETPEAFNLKLKPEVFSDISTAHLTNAVTKVFHNNLK